MFFHRARKRLSAAARGYACATGVLAGLLVAVSGAGPAKHPDAVFLEESIRYGISGSTGTLDVRVRVKVFTPDGKKHARIVLPESGMWKLKKFSGTVYDSEDRAIYSCEKNDVEKFCGFGESYTLYTDICFRSFVLTSDRYPFSAEWEYTIVQSSLIDWPDWFPQKHVPVERSTYELTVPDDFDFSTRAAGDIGSPSVAMVGGRRMVTWTAADVAAIEEEKYSVVGDTVGMRLLFAPSNFRLGKYAFIGRTWTGLSASYHEMARSSFALSNDQKLLCESIMNGAADPMQMCTSLHEALMARIRYVNVSIGIGGWLPNRSAETFSLGYGDCKAQAVLYASMLDHMGILAKIALIRTRTEGRIDPGFPRMSFNHAILFTVIDGDTMWTDPTCPVCGFGELPWYDEDVYALAIDHNGGDVVRTSASTAAENVVARKAVIEPNRDRSVSAMIEFSLAGHPCRMVRIALSESGDRDLGQLLRNDLFGLSSKFSVDSISCPRTQSGLSSCRVNVWGRVRNAVHSVGDKLYIDINFLAPFRDCERVDTSGRRRSICMLFPQTRIDTLHVSLPGERGLESLPEDRHLSDEFGTLYIAHELSENQLTVIRSKRTNHYQIDPQQFDAFDEHMAVWKAAVEGFVILTKR